MDVDSLLDADFEAVADAAGMAEEPPASPPAQSQIIKGKDKKSSRGRRASSDDAETGEQLSKKAQPSAECVYANAAA